MEPNDNENDEVIEVDSSVHEMDKLLEQKEKLDALLQDQFTRNITVMFTDLKGSTAIAEAEGDMATRNLIKQHNDIVLPTIKKYGTLVKTMGDGTLSYFENAQDGVRAAVKIQKAIDEHNVKKKSKILLLVRIGLHTGTGVVEEDDIYGDVVNVASRFESSANPGEIYISEDTFDAMEDKTEIYCRYLKTVALKGKKGTHKVFKAFWNTKEIEEDKFGAAEVQVVVAPGMPLYVKLLLLVFAPGIIAYALMLMGVLPNPFISTTSYVQEKRSLEHIIELPLE